MNDAIQAWLGLPDARLVDAAADRRGVWLWTDDAARLIWTNPAGSAVLTIGPVDPADLQRRQLAQLAPRLTGAPRLERLRGFGAAPGSRMTCACTRLTLADGRFALLVTAMDRAVPELPLKKRLARLVAPQDAALAAFTADGQLAAVSRSGRAILGEPGDLAGLGAAEAGAGALRDGHAKVAGRAGELALHRIGTGHDAALLVRPSADFAAAPPEAAKPEAPEPQSAPPLSPAADTRVSWASDAVDIGPQPLLPAPRRPLRFLWQMDAAGRFSFGSDPFTRLIGFVTAAALGRPWHEINAALHLDPEDRVLRAIATRRTFSGITVRWPVDGSDVRLSVELSALPLHDRERRFVGYRGFGVCRDLDALDHLALRRRDEALRPAPPEPPPPSAPPMDTPMPPDPPHNVLPFRTASGDQVASLTPVENNAFNELARQLSERLERPAAPPDEAEKAGEAAGRDAGLSAATLRAMLDTVADGALTLTPDGHVQYANRAALALFGDNATTIARRTVFDLLAPADHQAAREALAGLPASRDVQGRTRDGRTMPLAMTLTRTADGAAFAVFRDLTAEQALARQHHDLQRRIDHATADNADLAGWTSRELRAPLESVSALADIMIDERFGPLGNEQYAAHLRDIRAAAQRIGRTLDELRDFSRIERGDFELAPARLNLNDVVEAAIADQQPRAGRARVVIRSSLAPALPPVEADAAALRQITGNLIAISVHLANAGGQAIVSTARADDGRVTLRLRDTGPGLTEEEQAAVAQPFRATTPADHATLDNAGINLALTRALIEASGAALAIRSAAASGTLIEVVFARADAAEPDVNPRRSG